MFPEINNFPNKQIAVIGDVMLDEYIYAKIRGVSPEAPVLDADIEHRVFTPGGAANVAKNLSSLGANVELFGVVGNDNNSILLRDLVQEEGIYFYSVVDYERSTTLKIRTMLRTGDGSHQATLKLNEEVRGPNSLETNLKLYDEIVTKEVYSDAYILSDYNKGVFTPVFSSSLLGNLRDTKKPIVVDPKPENIGGFQGVTLLCPNLKAAGEITGRDHDEMVESYQEIALDIKEKYGSEAVIITCGKYGMVIYDGEFQHIETKVQDVYDVIGAGDTVMAALTLSLSSGLDLHDAAVVANHAAGIVVRKVGTASVSLNELIRSLGDGDDIC